MLGRGRRVSSITLVDPLVMTYAEKTRGCTYRDHRLAGWPVQLIPQPGEQVLPRLGGHSADTMLLISTLQSAADVPALLQATFNVLRPGGWLVFADRVFDVRWDAYRKDSSTPFWDVGHPCAIKQTVLDHFLSFFDEMHTRRFTKDAAPGKPQLPPHQQDEQLYFIGRKRPVPASVHIGA